MIENFLEKDESSQLTNTKEMSLIQTESLRNRIVEILNQPMSGAALSNLLFAPYGLFNRMATSEEERQGILKSDLYQQAWKRYGELRSSDLDEFESHWKQLASRRSH